MVTADKRCIIVYFSALCDDTFQSAAVQWLLLQCMAIAHIKDVFKAPIVQRLRLVREVRENYAAESGRKWRSWSCRA